MTHAPISYTRTTAYQSAWASPHAHTQPSGQLELVSSRSWFRGTAVLVLLISACLLSYVEDTGSGLANTLSRLSQVTVAVLGIWILAGSFTGSRFVFPAEFILLVMFGAWCLATLPVAVHPQFAAENVITLAKLLLMALVMMNLINGRQAYLWFLFGLIVVMLIMSFGAFTGLVQGSEVISTSGQRIVRQAGVFGNSNEAGRTACLAGWAAVSLFFVASRRFTRVLLGLALLWSFVVIGMAGSKQAVIAFFLAGFATYWWVIRTSSRASRKLAWLIVLVSGLGLGAIYLTTTAVGDRMDSFVELLQGRASREERSDESRRYYMTRSIQLWWEHPVTGVGYCSSSTVLVASGNRSPHNTLFSIAAETGLPGWGLFFGAWGLLLLRLRRVRKLGLTTKEFRLVSMGLVLFACLGLWTLTGQLNIWKPFWVCFAGVLGYLVWLERAWYAQMRGV